MTAKIRSNQSRHRESLEGGGGTRIAYDGEKGWGGENVWEGRSSKGPRRRFWPECGVRENEVPDVRENAASLRNGNCYRRGEWQLGPIFEQKEISR